MGIEEYKVSRSLGNNINENIYKAYKNILNEGKGSFEVNVKGGVPMLGKGITYMYKADMSNKTHPNDDVAVIMRNIPKGLKIERKRGNMVWLTGDAQLHHTLIKKLQDIELSGEVSK